MATEKDLLSVHGPLPLVALDGISSWIRWHELGDEPLSVAEQAGNTRGDEGARYRRAVDDAELGLQGRTRLGNRREARIAAPPDRAKG